MPINRDDMRAKRDKKVHAAMGQWAPIWLENEEYRPREDSLLFNLVYQHPIYSWVSQRYKYDGFNDVLYHMGEKRIREEETLSFQEAEPYLPGEISTRVPNEPAQRPSPPLPGIKG